MEPLAATQHNDCYYCSANYLCHIHRKLKWSIVDYRISARGVRSNPPHFQYFCNICLELTTTAILLLCGHLLCDNCMFNMLMNQSGKKLKCPTCKILHKYYYYLGPMDWDNVECEQVTLAKDQIFMWHEHTIKSPLTTADRIYFHNRKNNNIIAICRGMHKCRKFIRIFTDITIL